MADTYGIEEVINTLNEIRDFADDRGDSATVAEIDRASNILAELI